MCKPEETMWVSGNHIYIGDHDDLVATIQDRFLEKKHILGAAAVMFEALEELEGIDFGVSGSRKDKSIAIRKAIQALASARGKLQ